MRDYPEELLPDEENVSLAEYRAMAEWHWAHNTLPQARAHLRERAERRRNEMLANEGVDLDDPGHVDAAWSAWQLTWHESLNYGVDSFGDEYLHPLVHIMQYTSIVLLLATEPNTPDPYEETFDE